VSTQRMFIIENNGSYAVLYQRSDGALEARRMNHGDLNNTQLERAVDLRDSGVVLHNPIGGAGQGVDAYEIAQMYNGMHITAAGELPALPPRSDETFYTGAISLAPAVAQGNRIVDAATGLNLTRAPDPQGGFVSMAQGPGTPVTAIPGGQGASAATTSPGQKPRAFNPATNAADPLNFPATAGTGVGEAMLGRLSSSPMPTGPRNRKPELP
jgi:hypothetical protein